MENPDARQKLELMVCGEFNPEELTLIVGFAPHSTLTMGQSTRQDPARKYQLGYWTLLFEISETNLDEVIDNLIDRLEPSHIEWLGFLQDNNLNASIVGTFNLTSSGFAVSLGTELLLRMTRFKIGLDFSVE